MIRDPKYGMVSGPFLVGTVVGLDPESKSEYGTGAIAPRGSGIWIITDLNIREQANIKQVNYWESEIQLRGLQTVIEIKIEWFNIPDPYKHQPAWSIPPNWQDDVTIDGVVYRIDSIAFNSFAYGGDKPQYTIKLMQAYWKTDEQQSKVEGNTRNN